MRGVALVVGMLLLTFLSAGASHAATFSGLSGLLRDKNGACGSGDETSIPDPLDNGDHNDFTNYRNWDTAPCARDGVVPNGGDATIPAEFVSSRAVISHTDLSLATLNLLGELKCGDNTPATLTVSSTFNFKSGVLNANLLLPTNAAIMTVSDPGDKVFYGILDNLGTINWDGSGSLFTNLTSTINNKGTINLRADGNFIGDGAIVNNTGIIVKTVGSGTSSLASTNLTNGPDPNTHQGGILSAQSGLFNCTGGEAVSGGGGVLTHLNDGTTITTAGNGKVVLSNLCVLSGTINVNGVLAINIPATVGNPSAHAISGVATFNGSGRIDWQAGGVIDDDPNRITIGPNFVVNLEGVGDKVVSNVTNNGTINWLGGHLNRVSSTTGLTNNGVFNVLADDLLCDVGEFTNNGTVAKSTGVGMTTFVARWTNTSNGIVDVQAGTLQLGGGLDDNPNALHGGTTVNGAGRLIASGSTAFDGTINVNGTLELGAIHDQQTFASFSGTPTFAGPGFVDWTSGNFVGNGTIATFNSGLHVTVEGGGDKGGAVPIVNNGIMNWQGGNPLVAANFTNNGIFNALVGNSAFDGVFNNATNGTLNTFPGGTTNFSNQLNNEGTVNIGGATIPGIFNVSQFTQTGSGTLNIKIGGLTDGSFDKLINGTFILGGTLHTQVLSSYTPQIGDALQIINGASVSGTFANVVGGFNAQYGPSTVSLIRTAPPGHTYYFTGYASYNSNCNVARGDGRAWDDPRNWSTVPGPDPDTCPSAGPPGPGDTAVIDGLLGNNDVNIDSDKVVANLRISDGHINFTNRSSTGSITVTDTFDFAGYSSVSALIINLPGGATFNHNAIQNSGFDNCILNNYGAFNFISGDTDFNFNNTFNNKPGALFNYRATGSARGVVAVFNNEGRFQKTIGTGVLDMAGSFNNSGTVDIQSGTLQLSGGGTDSGIYNTAAGAFIQLTNGLYVFTDTSRITGAGQLQPVSIQPVETGTITLDGAVLNIPDRGGLITDNAGVTLVTRNGGFVQARPGSFMNGIVNLTAGSRMEMSNFSIAGTLNNSGTINWTGDIEANLGSGGNPGDVNYLNNLAGGTFNAGSGGSLAPLFSNAGTVNIGGATTPGIFNVSQFTQTGSGTLNLKIGGVTAGSYDKLTNGNFTLGGTLNETLLNGYTPQAGDSINVINGGTFSGTFATVNGPMQATYSASAVTLTAGSLTPTITSFSPAAGPTGTSVTISGTNLNRVTGVLFNNTPATQFKFNSGQITATAPTGATTGKIKVTTASSDPNDFGISASDFTVSAFTLSVAPNVFSEAAGANAATGTITLNAALATNLTVSVDSSNPGKVAKPADVTIPAGQTGATFAVTAVDNAIADGPAGVTLTAKASGFADSSFPVTVTDNDTVGIIVTPTSGLQTSENLQTATFTMRLNSQPTANVTIGLSSSNLNEGTVSPASVTFNASTWNVSQTVTVTGVDDAVADGNVNYTIVTAPAVSQDGGYNSLNAADVTVTNSDNDTPGITVTPNGGLFTKENGQQDSFSVRLNSQPTANVTITISSSNAKEGTVALIALVFTPQNWSTFQRVTVTGVPDGVADGDQKFTIITGAATSSDANYNGREVEDVGVTNVNIDVPTLTLALSAATVVEGTPITGTVTRNTPTTADLPVTLTSSNGAIPVQGSVTIPAGQTQATFTINTTDDAVAQGNRSTTFTATAGTLSDAKQLLVGDNDVATLTLSITPTTFAENSSAVATLKRNTPLDAALVVSSLTIVNTTTNTTTGQTALAKLTDNNGNLISSIAIPAGSESVAFKVVGIDDGLPTLNRAATVSAAAGTITATPVTITVTNVDPPAIPAPTISSLSPASGPVGSLVTINGANLAGAAVKFGTVVATLSPAPPSATQLVVNVPAGLKVGSTTVTVTTPTGSASKAFTVTAPPTKTFSLSGSVLQGTKPVTGAKVLLIPTVGSPTLASIQNIVLNVLRAPTLVKQVAVDAHGNYSFKGLTPGSYLVAPYKPGTAFTTTPYRTGASLVPYKVITVTAARIGDVLGVNFLAQMVDSVKPVVTVVNPGGKAVFTPTSVPTATGVATDAGSGVLGVGVVLAQVNSVSLTSIKVSFYNWVTNRFDAPATLTLSSNPLAALKPEEIKVAPLTGTPAKSTWSLPLPHTLNAGSYRVIPLAVDKALNLGYPSIITSQGNFTVTSARSTAQAAPLTSNVKLSTGAVSVAKSSVTLQFIGALDADTASDAAHYSVEVNGNPVTVESAGYDAAHHIVSLSLPGGALQDGDRVVVNWSGLEDEQSRILNGQTSALSAR